MWDVHTVRVMRVTLWRSISLLAASLFVAFLASLTVVSSEAKAAPAEWKVDGENVQLTYEDNVYSKVDLDTLPSTTTPAQIDRHAYRWIETLANGDTKAHIIYFSEEEPQESVEARLIVFKYKDNIYYMPSPPEKIEVTANQVATDADAAEGDEESTPSTCDGSVTKGLGYVICPVSNLIASMVDGAYVLIESFLEVSPITTKDDGIYQLWQITRSVANVCFVIVFLVIIYSQITTIGLSNHNLKIMLPRLVIGAILVNVSYWICAVGIDTSNLLGHSIQSIFINVRDNTPLATDVEYGVGSWSAITNMVLSGGGVAAGIAGGAAIYGAPGALLAMIGIGLLSAAFGIFVAFVILAARQGIIVVLVILAPLAFVAYVLPSTKGLFDKWRKSLTSLLVFFPIFALLFGGTQLAGTAIISSAATGDKQLHVVIIGLAVQVVPLVITPLLIQFSTGILGRIANMANSKRGPIDGMKNRLREQKEYAIDKNRAKENPKNPLNKLGQAMYARDQARKRRQEGFKSRGEINARRRGGKTGEKRRNADLFAREAELDKSDLDQQDEGVWNKQLHSDSRLKTRSLANEASRLQSDEQKSIVAKMHANAAAKGEGMEGVVQGSEAAENAQAMRLASEHTALQGMAKTAATRELDDNVNQLLLNDTQLANGLTARKIAAGVGKTDVVMAEAISKDRKQFNEISQAQRELMAHFKVDSGDVHRLSMGAGDVEIKDKKTGRVMHVFHAADEHTHDAAIEEIFNVGSHNEKMDVIKTTGIKADGTEDVNYDYRRTVQQAAIKSNISRLAPAISDKTLNEIVRGEFSGDASWKRHSVRQVTEGRLKTESLAGANHESLKLLFNSNNQQDPDNKSAYDALSDSDKGKFNRNHESLKDMSRTILSSPQIRNPMNQESVDVMVEFLGYDPAKIKKDPHESPDET